MKPRVPPRFWPSRDQRETLRIPVAIETTVCSTMVTRRTTLMTDISAHGCRLETPFGWRQGSTVVLTIPSLSPRGARICWVGPSAVGLQFAQSLSWFVLDHIVQGNHSA